VFGNQIQQQTVKFSFRDTETQREIIHKAMGETNERNVWKKKMYVWFKRMRTQADAETRIERCTTAYRLHGGPKQTRAPTVDEYDVLEFDTGLPEENTNTSAVRVAEHLWTH
jgi:hypothetical protein